MSKSKLISFTVRRPLGVAAVLALGVMASAGTAIAQTAAPANTGSTASLFAQPANPSHLPTFEKLVAGDDEQGVSSSVSSSDTDMTQNFVAAANVDAPGISDAMQYGGRQRYGRPRYRGSNTNADGSEKYTVYAGAGMAAPVGTTSNTLDLSYSFQVGVSRNWNRHFGVGLQFDWDNFGFTGQTLANQLALYNEITEYYDPTGQSNLSSLDGNTHVWSFTLNPTYTLFSGEGLGAYVIGGGGFYHKVATFTTPGVGVEDYFGELIEYQANETVDHYTSNAVGLNGGFGLTYKFSKFANQRLFAEVRYVHIFNQYRPGVTLDTLTNLSIAATNDFPQNSLHTDYIPVKFGIRF